MRTNIEIIKPFPIPPGLTAFEIAAERYKKWKSQIPFHLDLLDYLRTGIVVSRPTCFGMARIIELPDTKEPAWFVRAAVGDLRELLSCIPGYLPKICFCRHQTGKLRIYSLERLCEIVNRVRERNK